MLQDSNILLTQQKLGPYKDKWGLPGGGIEFGESFEDTITRELLEETALIPGYLEILMGTSSIENNQTHRFHQTGVVYQVYDWKKHPEQIPEEVNRWVHLSQIDVKELTPIAKQVVNFLNKIQET